MQNEDLANYTETTYAVWVETPNAGRYQYQGNLIYSVALKWAEAWNATPPADVVEGTTFHAVAGTTTFSLVIA